MLEFKNVKVTLQGNNTSKPFTLVVSTGEVVCLCGSAGTGKTFILRAILGLEPLAGGYITVDGELVTPGASAYFRQLTSYVPQLLPDVHITVGDLCDMVMDVRKGDEGDKRRAALAALWARWGIDNEVRDRRVNTVRPELLQQVMLVVTLTQDKPMVLIDNPSQTAATQMLLQELAAQGKEVVYTCRTNQLPCHQIVNL